MGSDRRSFGSGKIKQSPVVPKPSVATLADSDAAFTRTDDSWVKDDDIDFSANPFGDPEMPGKEGSGGRADAQAARPAESAAPTAASDGSAPQAGWQPSGGQAERWDDSKAEPSVSDQRDPDSARPAWGGGDPPAASQQRGGWEGEPRDSRGGEPGWAGSAAVDNNNDDVRFLDGGRPDRVRLLSSGPADAPAEPVSSAQPRAEPVGAEPEGETPVVEDEEDLERDKAEMRESIERARARRQQEEADREKQRKEAAKAKLEALDRRRRMQELEQQPPTLRTRSTGPKTLTLFQREDPSTKDLTGRVPGQQEGNTNGVQANAPRPSPWGGVERPPMEKNPWNGVPADPREQAAPIQAIQHPPPNQQPRPPPSVWGPPHDGEASLGNEPAVFLKPLTLEEAETRPSAEGKKLFNPYDGEKDKDKKRERGGSFNKGDHGPGHGDRSPSKRGGEAPERTVRLQHKEPQESGNKAKEPKESNVRVRIKGKTDSKSRSKDSESGGNDDARGQRDGKRDRGGKAKGGRNELTVRIPKSARRADATAESAVLAYQKKSRKPDDSQSSGEADGQIDKAEKPAEPSDPAPPKNAWAKPLVKTLAEKASAATPPAPPAQKPSTAEAPPKENSKKERGRKGKKEANAQASAQASAQEASNDDGKSKSESTKEQAGGAVVLPPQEGAEAGPTSADAGVATGPIGVEMNSDFAVPNASETLSTEGGLGGLAHIWGANQGAESTTAAALTPATSTISAPSLAAQPSIWDNGAGAPAAGAVPLTSLQQAFAQPTSVPTGPWSGGYSNPVAASMATSHPSTVIATGKSPTIAGQSPQVPYRSLVSQPYYPASPYGGNRVQLVMPGVQLIQQSSDYAMYQQPSVVYASDQSPYTMTSHFASAQHRPGSDQVEYGLSADAPTFKMPPGGEDPPQQPAETASLGGLPAAAPTAGSEESTAKPASGGESTAPTTAQTYVNQQQVRTQSEVPTQPVIGTSYQYPQKFVYQPLMYAGEYSHFPTAYVQDGSGNFDSRYGQLTGGVHYQGVGQMGAAAPVGSRRTQPARGGQRGALPDSLIPHLGNVGVLGESKLPDRSGQQSVRSTTAPKGAAISEEVQSQIQPPPSESAIPSSLFGLDKTESDVGSGISVQGGGIPVSTATSSTPASERSLEILYTFESSFSAPPQRPTAVEPSFTTPVTERTEQAPAAETPASTTSEVPAPEVSAQQRSGRGRSTRGRGRSRGRGDGGRTRGRGRRGGQDSAKKEAA